MSNRIHEITIVLLFSLLCSVPAASAMDVTSGSSRSSGLILHEIEIDPNGVAADGVLAREIEIDPNGVTGVDSGWASLNWLAASRACLEHRFIFELSGGISPRFVESSETVQCVPVVLRTVIMGRFPDRIAGIH